MHDVLHAGNGLGFRGIEAGDLAAEHGAALERGVQHPRTAHVEPESCGSVDLQRSVEALGRGPDQLELRRGLQRNVGGRRQLGRGFGQRAIGQPGVRRGIDHAVVLGAALRFIDFPLLRGRLYQHLARSGAGLAQRLPGGANAQAAVGAHHRRAVCRLDARKLGADLLPVALQLLGQQLRERRDGALTHLGLVDLEGDRIVGADLHERIQLNRTGRLRLTLHRQLEADQQPAANRGSGS